ncbi:UDP-glucose/GDP-mannose dehydrogenase family protein [Patescibacteria group bacterium]|nr:UDP-glucose/GDP-mannose dehydrogenase family protein [Patescibacteria group bacterium]MBU1705835.1 UDP-glucose/GDP-mannose dehydrogenase family protein [Patescibacteria group bacterium]
MNIVIIGTGYVGLVSGLGLAKLGHRVACVDTDESKIQRLDMGEPPFFEPGLSELLHDMQNTGHVVFTSNIAEVLADAEIIILAVGTPPGRNGEADLSYLFTAAESIGQNLEHEAIVVVKSTVPVGTNRQVIDRIRSVMKERGRDDLSPLVQIASVPEFLREGSALQDFMNPDRVVIGCDDEIIFMILDRLHDGINGPRLMMSVESAELSKYAANAFLATKISFINEIANIAERTGGNVLDVAKSIGLDKRIGPHFLKAGLGYGGSCFPKDVSALRQLAGVKGYDFKLLSAVIEANNRQRENFFKKVESNLVNLKGRKLAVWGLAFKNNTDDIRDSAAIDLVQRLYARGAELVVYDPEAMANARRVLPDGIEFVATPIDAARGAEALLILTEWPEFRGVSWPTLLDSMVEPKIFDGRNLLADLDLAKWGFEYHGVGI